MAATNASFGAVLALFNAANGTNYTLTDVTFEQVTTTTSQEATANGGANTKAWLRPIKKLGQVLDDQGVWVFYNRQPLSTVMPLNSPAQSGIGLMRVSDLIPFYVNRAYGTNLQHWDVMGDHLPMAPTADTTATLTAHPGSPAYTGSMQFKFNRNVTSYVIPYEGTRYMPPGVAGTAYTWQVAITGGVVSGTPTITGSLPPGLSMSYSSSTQVISITGNPTTAGAYTFTLNWTISGSGSSTQSRKIVVHSAATGSWTSTAGSPRKGSFSNPNDAFTYGASASSAYSQVCSNVNMLDSTKKHYFEIMAINAGGFCDMEVGLAIGGVPGNTGPASDSAQAWMLQQKTGEIRHNGVRSPGIALNATQASGSGPMAFACDYYVGFHVDATTLSAVKVWISVNGSLQKDTAGNTPNPATGAFPTFTFDATGATAIYPCASFHSNPSDTAYYQQMATIATSSTDTVGTPVSGFTTLLSA